MLSDLKLNADQLFFVSYARVSNNNSNNNNNNYHPTNYLQNWCSVMRKEYVENIIKTNPHPPDRHRVNVVVGNSVQFAKTFNCTSGSRMNPVDKCSVW